MGYEVAITRGNQWENHGVEISREEWLAVVEADSELSIALVNEYQCSAVWKAHPTRENDGPWLHWSRGNITAKNPDNPTIEKMVVLASQLKARVQGESGVIFFGNGKTSEDPLSKSRPVPHSSSTQTKAIGAVAILLIFLFGCLTVLAGIGWLVLWLVRWGVSTLG